MSAPPSRAAPPRIFTLISSGEIAPLAEWAARERSGVELKGSSRDLESSSRDLADLADCKAASAERATAAESVAVVGAVVEEAEAPATEAVETQDKVH